MGRSNGSWRSTVPALMALLVSAGVMSGCAAREMVLVDPRVDLQQEIGRRVLVMPVQSHVAVPSDVLAVATKALQQSLGETEGLSVVGIEQAGEVVPVGPDGVADPAAVRRAAEATAADVVVLAHVPEYWERQLREFAQRHSLFAGDALSTRSSWSDRPRAEVLLRVVVGFYEGSSGRLLWRREALSGESDEAPLAETAAVIRRLHHTVAKQIGDQVVSDLYPYFTYQ